MTSRALTLHHQTRLAVQVMIEDDTGALIYSILIVTSLFARFRQASQVVTATKRELSLLVTDLKVTLDFTAKVVAISFHSLAFGLGVTL